MDDSEIIEVTLNIVDTLEKLEIDYVVGGSIASSMHGIPRSTRDTDILVFMTEADVDEFVSRVETDFYISKPSVREAIENRSSFNVIHLETAFKVDFFVAPDNAWSSQERTRRRIVEVTDGGATLAISSAEDNILHKLRWYEKGNRTSDQQWRDVLGVLKVSGDELDVEYLRKWSRHLGFPSLLEEAFEDAGFSNGTE